jgi:hypothetical protein
VFQQQERVADLVFFAEIDQRLLQAQPGDIINPADLENRNNQEISRGLTRMNAD